MVVIMAVVGGVAKEVAVMALPTMPNLHCSLLGRKKVVASQVVWTVLLSWMQNLVNLALLLIMLTTTHAVVPKLATKSTSSQTIMARSNNKAYQNVTYHEPSADSKSLMIWICLNTHSSTSVTNWTLIPKITTMQTSTHVSSTSCYDAPALTAHPPIGHTHPNTIISPPTFSTLPSTIPIYPSPHSSHEHSVGDMT